MAVSGKAPPFGFWGRAKSVQSPVALRSGTNVCPLKPFRSPFSSDRALFLRGITTSGLGQWALGTRGKPGARRGELQRRRRCVRLQPSGFRGGWCHWGPWLLGGAGGRAAASSSECFEARGGASCRGVRNSEGEGAWDLLHERQQS